MITYKMFYSCYPNDSLLWGSPFAEKGVLEAADPDLHWKGGICLFESFSLIPLDSFLLKFSLWFERSWSNVAYQSIPRIVAPRNVYETPDWRDLNYYRELLNLSRSLALSPRTERETNVSVDVHLQPCLQEAANVIHSYKLLHASDKLVMNRTCVHVIVSAGCMALCCAVIYMTCPRHRHQTRRRSGYNKGIRYSMLFLVARRRYPTLRKRGKLSGSI